MLVELRRTTNDRDDDTVAIGVTFGDYYESFSLERNMAISISFY